MTPARWAQVKDVFGEAFERPEAERSAFLDGACAGDTEMRAEVERLLAESDGDSLHSPASGILRLASDLRAGDRVAHYRIESRLGEGGMGVVYKAADSRLGRSVALKFVKAEFGSRSQREARAVAALNHPNICTIHDVGPNYLVMELIEGRTLAERIAKGAIPLKEATDIAHQIAEALEAAHEKGIVHRDLKPANIKLTAEGKVKVLDFGLAQIQVPLAGNPQDSPTMTATQAGMILGTAGYMSPEQASGKPVDKRADIWAFGVVLWEMLMGHRLFEGETVTQTLAEVLRGPIDFERTPPQVRNLLRRCLDRDVTTRLRDIGEARIALAAGTTEPIEHVPARRLWLAWSVAVVAVVGLASISFLHFREKKPAVSAPLRFQIPMPDHLGPVFNLSPDGRQLVFQAGGHGLGTYSLESGTTRYLGVGGYSPCWSPDGRFIAYRSGGRNLMRIEATGGSPSVLAESPPGRNTSGCAWSQNDVILFVSGGGIFKVPASGGVPAAVTAPDRARPGGHQIGPSFLPDGRHFFYASHSIDEKNNAIYLGSVDAMPDQQSSKPLLESRWQAVYAAAADPNAGYLLFMREDALMAQPFDNRHLELSGQPVTIAGQVSHAANGAAGWGAFSVSANGVLSFQASRLSDRQLTWYDRAGEVLGTVGEPGDYKGLALSPDGARLAVSKGSDPTANIWLVDLAHEAAATRFTFSSSGSDRNPVWSPDGRDIIFTSERDGGINLYRKPASGAQDEELVLRSGEKTTATSWSPDKRFLLFDLVSSKTSSDILVLPLEGERKPVSFQATQAMEAQARISPDGHWVAYMSVESGANQVYVRPFLMNSSGTALEPGGKWQVSNKPGREPHWRADGRELFYVNAPGGGVMAVDIAAGPEFRAGKPHALGLTVPLSGTTSNLLWDVSADGQRFIQMVDPAGQEPITVLMNWQAGLKK